MAHDSFVKHWLSHPDTARDLRVVLPSALQSAIDWSTLREGPTESTDERGQELRSDIVLEVQTLDRRPLLLHVHVEHQRDIEAWMALRTVEYQVRLWRRWVRERHAGAPAELPAIITLVLYNGRARWSGATAIEDLVHPAQHARVGSYLMRCTYHLVDVREIVDDPALGPDFRLERVDSFGRCRHTFLHSRTGRMSTERIVGPHEGSGPISR